MPPAALAARDTRKKTSLTGSLAITKRPYRWAEIAPLSLLHEPFAIGRSLGASGVVRDACASTLPQTLLRRAVAVVITAPGTRPHALSGGAGRRPEAEPARRARACALGSIGREGRVRRWPRRKGWRRQTERHAASAPRHAWQRTTERPKAQRPKANGRRCSSRSRSGLWRRMAAALAAAAHRGERRQRPRGRRRRRRAGVEATTAVAGATAPPQPLPPAPPRLRPVAGHRAIRLSTTKTS
jgi:hypothetical protein